MALRRKTPLRRKAKLVSKRPKIHKWIAAFVEKEATRLEEELLAPRNVSTSRRPGAAIGKSGDALSPRLRSLLIGFGCFFCDGLASEVHHFPSVGAIGFRCDALSIPICRYCHHEAQTYRISKERQFEALGKMALRLWSLPEMERQAILQELME